MTHHTHGGPLGGHRFNDAPAGALHSTARPASTYPGMPAGAGLDGEWLIQHLTFQTAWDLPGRRVEGALGGASTATDNWTITVTGTTPLETMSDDLVPSHLIITNSGTDNDSWEGQYTGADGSGEAYAFNTTGGDVFYETMFRLSDANDDDDTVEQVDWFMGFAATDTTVIDGVTDFIGFVKQDSNTDGAINFVSADAASTSGALIDGQLTATGWVALNPAANTPDTLAGRRDSKIMGPNEWITLGFYFDQSTSAAHFYVNRVYEGSADLTDQIPDQNLCLTIAVQNGEGVAKVMEVVYVRAGFRLDLI